MNSLVLLTERDSAWSPILWATQQQGTTGSDGRVVIERAHEWLSVFHDDTMLADYDEPEMARILSLLSTPAAYLVEWRGSMLLESLLKTAAHEPHTAIDNDHGLITAVREVDEKPIESWIRATRLP